MTTISPFSNDRFEYEPKHLYYLHKELIDLLENLKPTYLVGSRGTGKTTLLKLLNWAERCNNESLKSQLMDEAFSKKYIGVYFKFPLIPLQSFDHWLKDYDDDIYCSVITLLIDLNWLELISEAIRSLSLKEIIIIHKENELEFSNAILSDFSELFTKFLPPNEMLSLFNFSRAIKRIRNELINKARSRVTHFDPVIETSNFYLEYPGSFGRKIGMELIKLCNNNEKDNDENNLQSGWHFKICIDESERLTPKQSKVINTIIRITEWPIYPIFSFVAKPADMTSTFIPNLTLQKADRQLIVLEEKIDDISFKKMAEGVGKVRVGDFLNDFNIIFDLSNMLGNLDINELLESILNISEKPYSKELLNYAKKISKLNLFSQKDQGKEDAKDKITQPIYQSYLIRKLNLEIPPITQSNWQKRRQSSAEIRKRMVAAYLSICNEIKNEVRYSSADMLLQMCDKCIRDFLSQINEIFIQSNLLLNDFIKKRISHNIQDNALKEASRAKMASIPEKGISAPQEAGRIIDALAKITSMVQNDSNDTRHLKSNERGIFELSFNRPQNEHYKEIFDLISASDEAGYIRILSINSMKWKFRVHTSLAAAYGFSYRGAYYPIRIELNDLHNIQKNHDENIRGKIIKNIVDKINKVDTKSDDIQILLDL